MDALEQPQSRYLVGGICGRTLRLVDHPGSRIALSKFAGSCTVAGGAMQ